jgi:hypothetical protein
MLMMLRGMLAATVALLMASGPVWSDSRKEQRHWAFQPPSRPNVPAVRHAERVRTPIDAFLLARLESERLTFSADADKATLLRRAYLHLLGLPPSPEETDAFLADNRPDAYDRLLDRLLASPHFGERWGRHWLDVVGYADTVGFDVDANNVILSEGKWRYRDYVIAAFNKDKPYDRFITEQLAGDELVDWRGATKFTPEIRELLIATGYLRTARDESHEPESNIPLTYFGVLHNTVEIVGNSLMGLTVNCARCHSHKFDPIAQKEYYQLMAFFTPAYNPKNWKPVFAWKPEIKDRGLPDVSPAEQAAIDRHNHDIDRQVAEVSKRLANLRGPYEARLRKAKLNTLPEPIRADVETALAVPAAKRSEVQKYLVSKLEARVQVKPEEVAAAPTAADRTAVAKLEGEIATLNNKRQKFGKLQALYDVGPPPPTYLLKRGNFETPGEEVQPGFLHALSDAVNAGSAPDGRGSDGSAAPSVGPLGSTSGRRLALTHWLTRPGSRASALLARVMVNRLWQHVFGEGLVPTPENFGRSGEAPTHPELLEWLSSEFVRTGWRVKPMLKLLMTSTAYRQTSRDTDAAKADPTNRLLWRMRLQRLDAEVIRDSVLAVSGQLNPAMGGPPVLLHADADGMVVIDPKALPDPAARWQRSVYLLTRRAYNLSLLTVFDEPLVAVNCPRRDFSAVPLQSLTMLNDAFLLEQARRFADRVAHTAAGSREEAIRTAYRLALTRQPTAAELAICSELLERQTKLYLGAKRPASDADRQALVHLCHTLLNTSEFLYAE